MSHPGQDPNMTEDELSLQPLEGGHVGQRRPGARRDLRKEIKQTIKSMPGKKSNPVMQQVTPAARPASNRMPAARPVTGANLPAVAPIAAQPRPSEARIPVAGAAPSKAPSQPVIILPAAKPSGRQSKQSGLLQAQPQQGAFTADELAHAAPQQFAEPEALTPEQAAAVATDETQVRLKPPSRRPGSVRKGVSRANLHPVGSGRAPAEPSEADENKSVIYYAVGGGVLLLGFLFFIFGGKKAMKEEMPVRVVVKDEYNKKEVLPPLTDGSVKADKMAVALAVPAKADAPKSPEAEAAAAVATEKTEKKTEAPAPAPSTALPDEVKAVPKPAAVPEPEKPTDEVLGNKVTPSKIKSGEDEEIIEDGPKKKAPTVAKTDPLKPGTKPVAEEDGGEKKITGVLGGLIEKKEDPAKAAGPAAPPPPAKRPPFGPAVGKQPSVINDVTRLNGIERDSCTMLQSFAPGWWCRDYTTDGSNFNMNFRGKDKVIKMNPPNDVICSKLVGTLDLPSGFNAILRFEVASNDDKSQWNLVVRINGQEILPKQMVRTKAPTDWQEIIVPLGALTGKQFDIQIEGWGAVRDANKFKQQFVYIRNPYLDWQGRK